jgi:hypothetical protein
MRAGRNAWRVSLQRGGRDGSPNRPSASLAAGTGPTVGSRLRTARRAVPTPTEKERGSPRGTRLEWGGLRPCSPRSQPRTNRNAASLRCGTRFAARYAAGNQTISRLRAARRLARPPRSSGYAAGKGARLAAAPLASFNGGGRFGETSLPPADGAQPPTPMETGALHWPTGWSFLRYIALYFHTAGATGSASVSI